MDTHEMITDVDHGRHKMLKKGTTLFELLSNPPTKEIQGCLVPCWQVPSIEDRKAICKAISEWFPGEFEDIVNKIICDQVKED